MGDVALPRIAGVFLFAAVATNLIAFAIGSSRGLAPPPAFDFGDAQQLSRLSAESSSHWLPLTLSLLSPVLAIPAGLGIYHVLKSAGWPALFGVDTAIDALGYVGHFFSFGLAQLAFGIAIMRVPGISNWLGGLAFIPGLMIGWLAPLIAFAGRSPAPVIGIGIIAFVTWLIGMVVVLLRWKPAAALP